MAEHTPSHAHPQDCTQNLAGICPVAPRSHRDGFHQSHPSWKRKKLELPSKACRGPAGGPGPRAARRGWQSASPPGPGAAGSCLDPVLPPLPPSRDSLQQEEAGPTTDKQGRAAAPRAKRPGWLVSRKDEQLVRTLKAAGKGLLSPAGVAGGQ